MIHLHFLIHKPFSSFLQKLVFTFSIWLLPNLANASVDTDNLNTAPLLSHKTTISFPAPSSEAAAEDLLTLTSDDSQSKASTAATSNLAADDDGSGTYPSLLKTYDSRRNIFSASFDPSYDNRSTVRILSLDGGGVRGIVEIDFLRKLAHQTGKTIPEMFHLIAGTSAGGILTGALTLPAGQGDPKKSPPLYSTDFIFDLMLERNKSMFVKGWSLMGLLGPRYKSEPMERFIAEFFKDATFNRTTNDALITAYDIGASKPKIFKSWDESEIFRTRDILLATSAAPTYFSPRLIYPIGATAKTHLGYTLTDGGVTANKPTACAVAAARKIYPEATRFEIISLGTGKSTRPLHYKSMNNAGIVGWRRHLVDIFMNGQSTQTDYIMDTIFSPGEYSRWDPVLAAENASLDNTSDDNLHDLIQAEEDLISSRHGEFEALTKLLRNPKADLILIYDVRKR